MNRSIPSLQPAEPSHWNDELLEHYYPQLLKWALILTRGDSTKAQDIVHDLCLHFALTAPCLSKVENLDAYLYTSLRHIYLSSLARAAREALRMVSIADYDSIHTLQAPGDDGELLYRQNELRRICHYAVWRKQSSKTASCFILHFNHGYLHREIAETARLPLSAIYGKLRDSRDEVRCYLDEPGKLRFGGGVLPPEPTPSWSPVPSEEFFRELRQMLMEGGGSNCLPEAELLRHYELATPAPIPCALLAHIVGCDRCLTRLDQHFRRPSLQDREPKSSRRTSDPRAGKGGKLTANDFSQFRESLRAACRRVRDHRPRSLSIAVDGKIIACHDIRSEHNRVSIRIERPDQAQFIELFSEQGQRLAMVALGTPPPAGPYQQLQAVFMNDGRTLDLSLRYDGLGMNCEVSYSDPALSRHIDQEEAAPLLPVVTPGETAGAKSLLPKPCSVAEWLQRLIPSSALGWAIVLATVLCTGGFFVYRNNAGALDAEELLQRCLRAEPVSLNDQAEHQVVQFEEQFSDGRHGESGTVELWKEQHRYIRRFYDAQHQLVAAEWQQPDGKRGALLAKNPSSDDATVSDLWKQDVSAFAFSKIARQAATAANVGGGYEITTVGPTVKMPRLISATLTLDHHMAIVSEVLRIHSGLVTVEARFVQITLDRVPAAAVPDVFAIPTFTQRAGHHSRLQQASPASLAEAQIDLLYRLNSLGLDSEGSIVVRRTNDQHIELFCTVPDETRKELILSVLKQPGYHHLLRFHVASPADFTRLQPASEAVEAYEVGETTPAESILGVYFQSRGLRGEQLSSAVTSFSNQVIDQAEHALQQAYALHQLGSEFAQVDLDSMSLASQQHWSELVSRHALALESELHAIDQELGMVSPLEGSFLPPAQPSLSMHDLNTFSRFTAGLLYRTQTFNRQVGALFTSSGPATVSNSFDSLRAVRRSIPSFVADDLVHFGPLPKDGGGQPSASPARMKVPFIITRRTKV